MIFASLALAAGLPDVDIPLKTGARAPGDAAVVVGLEDYYELPDVPHADRDANAFADFLLYTRGVPSDRIARVAKANREKILAAVEGAASRVGADGTVWVYFAGHGGASPDTGERMLMGIDVQPDLETFAARSVSVAELRTAATASGAKAVFVLDTCYTGQGRGGSELLPGKRFAVPAYSRQPDAQVLEWSAASANQFSGPLDPAQHGAFTYLVIGALRGWADGQLDDVRDGKVSAEEAGLYVAEALRTLQLPDQTPVMEATGRQDWVLADHPRAEPRPTLTLPTAAPEPAPVPGPSPAPSTSPGHATVCFKRSKSLSSAVSAMQIASGDRTLVSVPLGGSECTELAPGTHTLVVTLKSTMLPVRKSIDATLAAGETGWFLIGTAGTLGSPEITQVSAKQYDEGAFKLLR